MSLFAGSYFHASTVVNHFLQYKSVILMFCRRFLSIETRFQSSKKMWGTCGMWYSCRYRKCFVARRIKAEKNWKWLRLLVHFSARMCMRFHHALTFPHTLALAVSFSRWWKRYSATWGMNRLQDLHCWCVNNSEWNRVCWQILNDLHDLFRMLTPSCALESICFCCFVDQSWFQLFWGNPNNRPLK